jgi:hypothetical protein
MEIRATSGRRTHLGTEPRRIFGNRRIAHTSLCLALTAAVGVMAYAGAASATVDSRLMRYPYLTDLTTTSVQVTFDTSIKITSATAAVRWGTPSGATGCTLTKSSVAKSTNTVNAPITVNNVTEYQNSITLTGLSAGTQYCYRVFTGGSSPVDLLKTDNAPRFSTMSTSTSLSFDVFGDWGDTSVAGGASQAKVDALIAGSGAKFAVSTGDIAYANGTQNNYGNLVATGSTVSEVFGPSFWAAPGATTPLFSTTGNHGRSSTFLQNWKQPATVAASNGKYAMETYSGQDSTTATSYPSDWYAFSSGGARFYVLTADWADTNFGTAAGGGYQVDRDYHWQVTSPEYQWLKSDLASHAGGLKFAFFHYPLRSDSATESSDNYLQSDPNNPGATDSLEGLLYNNGVNLAFNGHAHMYQRNVAPPGAVTSYVTGGGGAKLGPVDKSNCSPTDAYAIGWAYTSAQGSKCGSAPVPTSDSQVYHFLKVTISGKTVTVTPTDSNGTTFDAMTYNFSADSTAPSAPSGLLAVASGSSVSLSWQASASTGVSAQDLYRNGSFLATVPPGVLKYVDTAPIAGGSYTVRAHDLAGNQSVDSQAASVGSGADGTPPTTPGGLSATATSSTSVKLLWTASTDNVGVTGYRIYRGGGLLTTIAASAVSYVDNTVSPSTSYSYTVQAIDAAGNQSPQSAAAVATTPAGGGGGGALTFKVTDDATIDATNPTINAGSTTRLTADGSPVNDFLVKFSVTGTSGCQITKATLQLTVGTSTNNNSVKGGDIYGATSTAWSESTVTWNSAPGVNTGVLQSLGAVTLGETVTADVTSAVTGDGAVTFRVKTTSGDAAAYYSKQGSTTQGPQLLVTCT